MIAYRLRKKALMFCMSILSILLAGWWADSIIIRYDSMLFIVISALIVFLISFLSKSLTRKKLSNIILWGVFIGYFAGLITNLFLDLLSIEHGLTNFLREVQEKPFQVFVVFFMCPFFLAGWLQGVGIATSVWAFRANNRH